MLSFYVVMNVDKYLMVSILSTFPTYSLENSKTIQYMGK